MSVPILAAPLAIQLCTDSPEKQQGVVQVLSPLATHTGDLEEAPRTTVQVGPALAVVAIVAVNQWMQDSLSLSLKQIKLLKKISMAILSHGKETAMFSRTRGTDTHKINRPNKKSRVLTKAVSA